MMRQKVLAIIATLCISLLVLLSGCGSSKTVYRDNVRTEYKYRTDTIKDSIYTEVFKDRYVNGDTVYSTRTEYIYRYKWRAKTDTIYKTDSIIKTDVVEKKPSMKDSWGLFSSGCLVGVFIAIVLIVFISRRKG